MAETVNIGTGKIELTIGHPTDMATQTFVKNHIGNNVYAIANSGLTSLGSAATGVVQFSADTSILALRSWVTSQIAGATHSISSVTNLQSALDAKVDDSQVLANVPANMPFTTLQAELNKLTHVVVGISGLSLGGGAGAAHRFAVHEVEIGDPNHTAGHYMYGMGLYVGSTVGTAFWGGDTCSFTGPRVGYRDSPSSIHQK